MVLDWELMDWGLREAKLEVGRTHTHVGLNDDFYVEHSHGDYPISSHVHVQGLAHAHVQLTDPETRCVDEYVSYDKDPAGLIAFHSESSYGNLIRGWICQRENCKPGGWHFDIDI